MMQKIIQIGTSAGITIPKKQLKELGLQVGDEIMVTIAPVKVTKHEKLMHEYDGFVAQYGEALKNLADR